MQSSALKNTLKFLTSMISLVCVFASLAYTVIYRMNRAGPWMSRTTREQGWTSKAATNA